MSSPTPTEPRYTVDAYFGLVHSGDLGDGDHVELLDGVIVAEPPQDPPHASGTSRSDSALRTAVGSRAVVRVQLPLILGAYSAPEPDVAVVPGVLSDYDDRHPTTALLVLEVAVSSLPQDRLSKSRIYAGAGIPEYWILNVRDQCLEVFRDPDPESRHYATRAIAGPEEHVNMVAFPEVRISVGDLLPRAVPRGGPASSPASP